jgi:organic hydroperoxide reductase OsmC/OhrA
MTRVMLTRHEAAVDRVPGAQPVARPAAFPHHYAVTLEDRRLAAPPRAPIDVGAPPQFGGRDDVWSPEELLVGATLECLWTTFEAYARHDQLAFDGWRGGGVGVLDKGPTGPAFTSISLSVELTVAAADTERARRILDKAERHCIISNALRVPVTMQATIRPR